MNICEKEKNCFLLIAVIVVVLIFSGYIFRYQIITTATNTIVLNRLTGQKQIIKLNGEVVIEEFGSKDGPKLTPIDIDSLSMNMECKIKWRNGRLYYIADLSLPDSTYEKSSKYPNNANINIDLLDKDGYLIATIPIELNKFTRYPLEGTTRKLTVNDSISFKRSEFEAINIWDITWRGINK